jgi:hypothetical protein
VVLRVTLRGGPLVSPEGEKRDRATALSLERPQDKPEAVSFQLQK